MSSNGNIRRGGLGRTEIVVALIAMVGALGGALFAHWDKLFPPSKNEPPSSSSPVPHPQIQPSLNELKARVADLQSQGIAALQGGTLSEASRLFERADRCLESAEEQAPEDVMLIELRGYMWKDWALINQRLKMAEDTEVYLRNAEEAFRLALNRRPTEGAYNGLGSVYIMQGDLESAEREIRNALRLNPNYAAAKHDLELVQRLKHR
jgi:tetratricopeptide (TPR) repeat protein